MLGNFFLITVFCHVYDFTDINECKGNHSCHVNATCMNTLGSHVCQCHAGYTGNGQNCTGECNFFVTIFRIVLHDTFDHSAAPFSRVARKLDNLLLMTRYDLGGRFSWYRNIPDFWVNNFGDWILVHCYSPLKLTLLQWLTEAWQWNRSFGSEPCAEDGYVSDFPWRRVFVDARDIFEGKS